MVDGNDSTSLADALGVDFNGGGGEGGVDRVDGDGVVRVGRAEEGGFVSLRSGFFEGKRKKKRDALARDIDDNAQSTISSSFGDEFRSDKLGNRLGEVDAVDENVDIEDFGEWAALGGFGHVPLDDVFPNYQQGVSIR